MGMFEEIGEKPLSENGTSTKTLIITRKKKFASALMPYWIITGTSKKNFMEQYGLDDSSVNHLTLTTKGGFASVSCPMFEQE